VDASGWQEGAEQGRGLRHGEHQQPSPRHPGDMGRRRRTIGGRPWHGEEGHAVQAGGVHPANVDDPGLIPSAGALIFLHIHLK
jgi:hypothetical protein